MSTRKLTIARAISEAISQEMARDATVMVLGEDIGPLGGVFGTTTGLHEKYGSARVRDTPISETAFIGAAVGLAANGYRPIAELMFVDFFGVCMDAVYNLAAKQNYFSGGQVSCPMVLMTSVGGGYGDGGQHSQCLYATFGHLPGLKVVIPSTAYDAKGMMIAAIRDPNPVVFMYHKRLQGMGWLSTEPGSITHVPVELYETALDKAVVRRTGSDVTLVGLGFTTHLALSAAAALEGQGVSAEVVDLRSVSPIDRETIRQSVRKTGRLVAIDDDYHSFGVAGEVIASACEDPGVAWRSPPRRVTFPDIVIPYAAAMEHHTLPDTTQVQDTALAAVQWRAA